MWVKWKLISVHFDIVVISIQDVGEDSVNLDVRQVHGLRQKHYRLRNHFGFTRWYSDVTWLKWIPISVYLEIVLVSTQDRSTVCAEHTIGSKISRVHLMVLQGVMGEVEARFSLFRNSVNLDTR